VVDNVVRDARLCLPAEPLSDAGGSYRTNYGGTVMEDIEVTFPGGKRVDARVGPYTVRTDQPVDAGGAGSAVAPFDLFLASLATCAGIYVLGFCQARSLSTDGIRLRQRVELDPASHLPKRIRLELQLPASFPEKYRAAVAHAAAGCKVKKTIAAAPVIEVGLSPAEAPAA
jgi:ribosomal protein S12 methylthiotransferase accessory factor